jgi:hypothetical protein
MKLLAKIGHALHIALLSVLLSAFILGVVLMLAMLVQSRVEAYKRWSTDTPPPAVKIEQDNEQY